MPEIILVLDNIRSTYNVGSILRSADGFGVKTVISVGLTPHPKQPRKFRLPHVISRAEREIAKTALGAERLLTHHFDSRQDALSFLGDTSLFALELTPAALEIHTFIPPEKMALVVGNEVDGVDSVFLEAAEKTLFIPMQGQKESFNVAVSTAIALYQLSLC